MPTATPLQMDWYASRTLYGRLFNLANQVWNGSLFEDPVDAHWATYVVPMPPTAGSPTRYGAPMPAGVAAGAYSYEVIDQPGDSAGPGDVPAGIIGVGRIDWDGSVEISLSTIMDNLNVFGGGVVAASPAPTTTTFTLTGSTLRGPSGFYTNPTAMFLLGSKGVNLGRSNVIAVHTVTGSNHSFLFLSQWPNVPTVGDGFIAVGG